MWFAQDILASYQGIFPKGRVEWWNRFDFTLRSMLRDSSPTLPDTMNYNKIFSITWIWSLFVLSLAYTGL